MRILKEYKCTNVSCNKYSSVIELLVNNGYIPQCNTCGMLLTQVISTTNFKITGAGVYSPGLKLK